jgi:hypothetical protein
MEAGWFCIRVMSCKEGIKDYRLRLPASEHSAFPEKAHVAFYAFELLFADDSKPL